MTKIDDERIAEIEAALKSGAINVLDERGCNDVLALITRLRAAEGERDRLAALLRLYQVPEPKSDSTSGLNTFDPVVIPRILKTSCPGDQVITGVKGKPWPSRRTLKGE